MLPINQFLNKIKYSGKFNQKDIVIYYKDRFKENLVPVNFNEINLENNFLIANDKTMPLHRIKEIRNKGIIIWKR